jgi:two-component system LytT family sensor kinase
MLKGRTFIYHFAFWAALYLLWIFVFRSYSFSLSKTMTIEFCYLIFITIDYYIISDFIIPHFLFRKRYALLIVTTVLTIGISAWLRTLVAEQMVIHFFHNIILPDFNSLYVNSVTNISLWILAVIIGKMIIDSNQTQQQVALLEKERIKNELDYLKAQINPHALFNSLNTIYGHIDKNNQIARNTLLQFSELLRYQLYDCGAEKVNLEKEIEYIKNYIVFQQLRKDERLKVLVDIKIIETDLKIAPLLLVVLIENAFKFVSTFSEKENKISIQIYTKDNFLYSSFINTKELQEHPAAKDSGGIGITNLKRRLQLLYNNKYLFTTDDSGDLYETSLIINLA